MKLLKIVSYIGYLLLIFFSCEPQKAPTRIPPNGKYFDSIDVYWEKELIQRGLQEFDKDSRWILYLRNSIQKPSCKQIKNVDVFVSFLELKLIMVNFTGDTLNLYYDFIYNDTLPISICSKNSDIISGVSYNLKTGARNGYLVGRGIYNDLDTNRQKIDPLPKQHLSFLKNNSKKLNPWFLNELKSRLIMD